MKKTVRIFHYISIVKFLTFINFDKWLLVILRLREMSYTSSNKKGKNYFNCKVPLLMFYIKNRIHNHFCELKSNCHNHFSNWIQTSYSTSGKQKTKCYPHKKLKSTVQFSYFLSNNLVQKSYKAVLLQWKVQSYSKYIRHGATYFVIK